MASKMKDPIYRGEDIVLVRTRSTSGEGGIFGGPQEQEYVRINFSDEIPTAFLVRCDEQGNETKLKGVEVKYLKLSLDTGKNSDGEDCESIHAHYKIPDLCTIEVTDSYVKEDRDSSKNLRIRKVKFKVSPKKREYSLKEIMAGKMSESPRVEEVITEKYSGIGVTDAKGHIIDAGDGMGAQQLLTSVMDKVTIIPEKRTPPRRLGGQGPNQGNDGPDQGKGGPQ